MYAGESPLDMLPRAGESLADRFKRLNRVPAVPLLSRHGFLNSLSLTGRRRLAAVMNGRRFRTECDICLAALREGHKSIWSMLSAPTARSGHKNKAVSGVSQTWLMPG
jgi:hypothetical protein